MAHSKRWHPSQESDELVFAVCDRFLSEMARRYDRHTQGDGGTKSASAAAVADWIQKRWDRRDLTREKIYPLFWEATRRNYLFLQPPRDLDFARRLAETFHVDRYAEDPETIRVINYRGRDALTHVSCAGGDLLLALIKRLGRIKREQGKADPRVHVGLGGGFSAMTVAKRLAARIYADLHCPPLVLHAISAGGFLVDLPQKAPVSSFSFFDDVLPSCEFVGLYCSPVVPSEQYEQVIGNPGVRESFERAREIDIVVTSFAAADDDHGLLNQYLKHLIEKGEIRAEILDRMRAAGWVGDVQFRPYTVEGPMLEGCPVKAVTLFDLPDLTELASRPDKYVVLLAGPCSECAKTKTEAMLPLLAQSRLRFWTHLITDVQTAGELLQQRRGEAQGLGITDYGLGIRD
jgi:hypothetical protein